MNTVNDAILALFGLGFLLSILCIFYLAHRLADTNRTAVGWANTCMTQTCAFNEDQRQYMRDKAELERPEGTRTHVPESAHERPARPDDSVPPGTIVMPPITEAMAYRG